MDILSKITSVEGKLGYEFRNKDLLIRALTHRSAGSDHNRNRQCYERLEFLGDSILGALVCTRLYAEFPDLAEGPLSKLKARMVSEPSLAKTARDMGLTDMIILGSCEIACGGQSKESIQADVLEAVIGAVYLDGGLANCERVFCAHIANLLSQSAQQVHQGDYKTSLQEFAQGRLNCRPEYVLTGEKGPPHERIFEVLVKINGVELGTGSGTSKKRAEQIAARHAWELLQAKDKPSSESPVVWQ